MTLAHPATPTIAAVIAFAETALPPFLLNHSYRTFHFGRLLIGSGDVDEEAAFIASLLHDIGLTDSHRGDTSFELVGAAVAARLLDAKQWPRERVRLVERAIERHVLLQPNDEAVERLVQAGTALDVAGVPPDGLAHADVARIVAAYPREGFVNGITGVYQREIAEQPDGAFANLERAVTLSALIAQHPFDR